MALINSLTSWFLKKRYHQMELFMRFPHDVQNELFFNLISEAEDTEWGINYRYSDIKNIDDFQQRVPISRYEDIEPYVSRLLNGEHNLLWPTETRWFAKSSGTTNAKSKFIPVTIDSLNDCHYKAGKDLLALYLHKNPDSEFLSGKTIGVAGSSKLSDTNDYFIGDLSAILMSNLPLWAHITKSPNLSIALMEDWSKKLELIVENTLNVDIRAISGVPSWMLVILEKVLEVSGKNKIRDVWPNFELVMHGGVSLAPYIKHFEKIMDNNVNYQEVYNASEGFFAIQDSSDSDELLLLLDYGIFYEFIALEDLEKSNPQALTIEQVELGKNYAMVISTNAGLWRYLIGDTVIFTSKIPYRIRISGRTKSYINVAGEELIVDNADFAINHACQNTGAIVNEYTAAPLIDNVNKRITHQWLIEFEKEPSDLLFFTELLDNALKTKNSDYEAKRFQNMVLEKPIVVNLPVNTFYKWLSKNGRLGGQYKVPRLSNKRNIIEELKEVLVVENNVGNVFEIEDYWLNNMIK